MLPSDRPTVAKLDFKFEDVLKLDFKNVYCTSMSVRRGRGSGPVGHDYFWNKVEVVLEAIEVQCQAKSHTLSTCAACAACKQGVLMLSRLLSSPGMSSTRRWLSSLPALAVDTWRNPAAILHGINDLRFEDFPLPAQLQHDSVRVQMKSVGICGSDVAFLKKVRSEIRTLLACCSAAFGYVCKTNLSMP